MTSSSRTPATSSCSTYSVVSWGPRRRRARSAAPSADFSLFLRGLAEHSGPRSVLHLHGALWRRDIILSLDGYGDQYTQQAMPERIYAIFATATVVFIGTSLTDADIMALIQRSHLHSDRLTRHYAFLPSGSERFDDILKENYGIEPIRYKVVHRVDGSQDHNDLDVKLTRLLELVEERLFATSEAHRSRSTHWEAVKGNAPPVASAVASQASLEAIKDGIRSHDLGLVTFAHPDRFESSRLLRNVAAAYRRLPARYRFRRVVFLSPSRLGMFPEHVGPRSVVHSMFGETVRALGHQTFTATVDVRRNVDALRKALMRTADGGGGEVTLFVIEEADAIFGAEFGLLNEVVNNLPPGSLVLREFTPGREHPLGAEPWDGRKWRGLWHVVGELADSPIASEHEYRRPPEELPSTDGRLLSALSILGNPVTSQELTAMTGMPPSAIEESAARLAVAGLLETEVAPVGLVPPDSGLGRLDVVSELRWEVLERVLKELTSGATGGDQLADFARQFEHTAAQIFAWAAARLFGLQDWGHDRRQLRQLNVVLPNLLSAYEAVEWMAAKCPSRPSAAEADTVRVGMHLASTLFRLGRWGEALEYMQHLDELGWDTTDAAILAEMQILRSRMLAFAGQSQDDFDQAESIVTPGVRFPELPPGPRHDLLGQRARIRRGVAVLRRRRFGRSNALLEEAREIFTTLYDEVFPGDGLDGVLPAEEELHDMALAVHAETAEYLAETMFAQVFEADPRSRPPREEQLPELLTLLDRQANALFQLEDHRGRGHYWRLRGEVLLAYKGPPVARRYFGQALAVALLFRDRVMEAGARLGLARSDLRRQEAEKAAEIYLTLDLVGMSHRANAFAQTLPDGDRPGRLRPVDLPRSVLFLGEPATRRRTALRATARLLTQWGLDPHVFSVGPDQLAVAPSLAPGVPRGRPAAMSKWVMLGELDGSPAEVLTWCRRYAQTSDAPDPLGQLLLVHLVPMQRPGQRNWVLPTRTNDIRWATEFEAEGAAYVSVNSNMPILELEDAIGESLAYSFLSIEELLIETQPRPVT